MIYDFNQSKYYCSIKQCAEFLIESFDGTSLMDSANEDEEEPPLRKVISEAIIKEDPETQTYKLRNMPLFDN